MSLFGNGDFVNTQVRIRSLSWTLIQYDCVLIKRESLDTYMSHRGYEDEDRCRNDASTSPEIPKVANTPPEAR